MSDNTKKLNYDPADPDKMKLPAGVACGNCRHILRCKAMFGHTETDTYCDWSPSRFIPAKTEGVSPMSDITALALLVSKAKASVFTMEYISQFEADDIDSDDVDLRFEVDGVETGTNVSIVDECGQAAQMIMALVEALEKAQSANAAQDDHINQQQDRIDQLEKGHQEAAKQINSWRRVAKQNIAEREKDISELDAARQRITSLESRTVTVKLPPRVDSSNVPFTAHTWNCCLDAVEKCLAAAGIQVIEGEG